MNNRLSLAPILWVLAVVMALLPSHAFAVSKEALPSESSSSLPREAPLSATGDDTPASSNTYTVKYGGTLYDVAHKFHCSVTQLKKLNHLKTVRLTRGQTLELPPGASHATRTASHSKAKAKSREIAFHSRRAEPVQDFDLSASTFASCPTPPDALAADDDVPDAAPVTPIPVAQPLRHASIPLAVAPRPAPIAPAITMPAAPAYTAAPAPSPAHRGFFSFFYSPPPATDWGTRFAQVARDLGNRGLVYDADWRPPGESHTWMMDCSNTSRYLYKVTAGIDLPRTASDQYYYLHLQNKAWDVPQAANGFADCNFLRQNLKPGDLLFWENTYRPERQPPITHVMIFLGTNARGEWIMAGSQTGLGGEHNRRRGGPDVYVFNPTRPCGGYSTWLGFVRHQGRFCAFGRPLEADRSKLSVAAND